MKPNLFKTMLVTLLTMLVAMNASAQTQTYFSCNFDNYTNTAYLTTNHWDYSGSVDMNTDKYYCSSGRAVLLNSAYLTTPVLNANLPSDVQLSFYAGTAKNNNVSLTVTVVGSGFFLNSDNTKSKSVSISIEKNSGKTFSYDLTECGDDTQIQFKAVNRVGIDNVVVTGPADPRTPVTLEYSADKHTTATESGEITGAPTLTVDPPAAESEVVFSSSNENVAKFEDGKLIAVAPGTTTITASISGSETYRDAKDEYTLTVGLASSNLRYNPTSVTVTYDKKDNFTAPELSYTGGYDGTITYTSDNPSVATVDASSGEVAINAVGVTTITASGAATPYLKASDASYTLIVKDIQGSATGGSGITLFKETFDKTFGTGGDREGQSGAWSGNITQKPIVADENGWNFYSSNQGGKQCIRQGAEKKKGYAETRQIEVEMGKSYTLTFKAAPWNQESTKMEVTADGCEISGISEDVMTPYYWNDYTVTITPRTKDKITIRFEASNNRFFLDEINVAAPSTSETVNVKIPASGWGTYCCQCPLDFTAASSPEGLKAYAVSSTSSSNVTLTEINQKLIGGTGIIINGTPGATYTIKVADKGTSYEGTNMLTGTLAPTYIREGQYFLKSGTFVYSKAGTLPANKAYLKSDGTGTQGAKLSFLFDTTSIEQVKVETSDAWYDLSGRKVNPSANVKGVYIHNGKKVVK